MPSSSRRRFAKAVYIIDEIALAIAGLPLPEGETIRGRNFLPLLRAEPSAPDGTWDNDFYAEYSTHHQSRTHMRMYRSAEWKLIRDFLNDGRDELYHLTDDPEETHNLIAEGTDEVAAITQQLHAKMLARMKEIGDPVLATIEQAARKPLAQP